MRIRFTLDITRGGKAAPDGPEAPAIYDLSGAHIEQADPHPEPDRPIGFRRADGTPLQEWQP